MKTIMLFSSLLFASLSFAQVRIGGGDFVIAKSLMEKEELINVIGLSPENRFTCYNYQELSKHNELGFSLELVSQSELAALIIPLVEAELSKDRFCFNQTPSDYLSRVYGARFLDVLYIDREYYLTLSAEEKIEFLINVKTKGHE